MMSHIQTTIPEYDLPCDCCCQSLKLCNSHFIYIKKVPSNYIWLDNPKCGSTTIRHALQIRWVVDSMLCKKITKLDNYFKFAFVRNPYSRMVSNWKMLIDGKYRHEHKHNVENVIKEHMNVKCVRDISFTEFVEMAAEVNNHHWIPQHKYIPIDVDYLGRIENFAQDFASICSRIGKKIKVIPKRNTTSHNQYTKYYTQKSKKIVHEMYAQDFELYNYKYGD